ncbi:hypothetical protein ACSRUE_01465 [Sorangium sp. KYC3313]|uniref:hypothetical protein n=1 Tax=Sorangium sp. KYC3313 TaxID=3449740 RepID=UPI003F8C1A36
MPMTAGRPRSGEGPLFRAAQVRSVNEAERRISAVASTESLDAHGTILRANWDLTRFIANPVLLWGNDDGALPIGLCENVRVEGKALLFVAAFDDATEFDQQVWEKYRRGVLRGFSVRFNPIERRTVEHDGRQVIEYTRSELMAISCTPVPFNPQALRRSAGDVQKHPGDTMKNKTTSGAGRSAVHLLVDAYPQMFPGELRSWALKESLSVVQSFINAGGHQSGSIPQEDAEKIDRLLGIRPASDGKVGYDDVDPIRGVRVFHAPTPGELRSAGGRS